ncbi:MAG: uracil-DNA glycosylase family protein [Chitinophagaceae bacterium]
MITWAENIIHFYQNLQPPFHLPDDVEWLMPQTRVEVQNVQKHFYSKFYNDNNQRTLILGINPGRFGAGATGINFISARQLTDHFRIPHLLKLQSELSAEFIYEVIQAYGGSKKFYNHYFISSVCPLGLVKQGKNINYYDDKKLLQAVEPFIISSIQKQLSFNVNRDKCICIGGEKNYRNLSSFNQTYKFFRKIVPLQHPRFIMQYRRKQKQEFIDGYLQVLQNK